MPCARPIRGWRLVPSSSSSGRMNGAKISSISAPLSTRIALSSWSTAELTTIGRTPACSPARRISFAAASALSRVSTNGMRKVRKSVPVNWVSRLWPMVSAVIPVPSEMKKTGLGWVMGFRLRARAHCAPAARRKVCLSLGCPGRDNGGLGSSPRLLESALSAHVLWLHQLRMSDLAQVGGKNSSLGEMIGHLGELGVSVPGGFATTADAFIEFVEFNNLYQRIVDRLASLDIEDVDALVQAGKEIRSWIIAAPLQPALESAVREAYARLCEEAGSADIAVAVRSSATAEDLPDASFAGQQETYLNVTGIEEVF